MSKFTEGLQEKADESIAGCKVCAILETLPLEEANEVDAFLRLKRGDNWKISAEKAVTVFKDNGHSVGSTTIRRHRKVCPARYNTD